MGRPNQRRNYGKTKAAVASVARERIDILLDQASKMVKKDEKFSRRYVSLARKISERTKTRIPREQKRYLCKACGIALVLGHNARVRLYAHRTGIVVTCLSCGAIRKYPVTSRIMTANNVITIKPYMSETGSYPKKNSVKD